MYFIQDLCCLCLKNEKILHKLSESSCLHLSYYFKMIRTLIPDTYFRILRNEGMICPKCLSDLELVYLFYRRCVKNGQLFVDYLSKLHSVGENKGDLNIYLEDCKQFEKKCKLVDFKQVGRNYVENDLKTEYENSKVLLDQTVIKECDNNLKIDLESLEDSNHASHSGSSYSGDTGKSFTNDISSTDTSGGVTIKEEIDIQPDHELNSEYEDEMAITYDVKDELDHIDECQTEKTNNMDSMPNNINNKAEPTTNDKTESQVSNSSSQNTLPQTKQKLFKCGKCSQGFSQYSDWITHKKTHIEYKCNTCKKIFSDNSTLVKHEIIHKNEKQFQCDKCPKVFSQNSSLTVHKQTHSKDLPFKCCMCEKSFLLSTSLAKHEAKHSQVRPFKCNKCTQAFLNFSSLVRHKKTHIKDKPFTCNMCPKVFAESADLMAHKRLHAVGKPFKCYCGTAYLSESELDTHKLTHSKPKSHIV